VDRRTAAVVGTAVVVAAVAALAAPAALRSGIDGTYRVRVNAADLRAASAEGLFAADDAGTWTVTFGGGRWTLRQSHGAYGNSLDRGTVTLAGPRALFTLSSADGFPHHEYLGILHWRTTPGSLRFTRPGHATSDIFFVLAARPWARVR
jgi:hypothetical protein